MEARWSPIGSFADRAGASVALAVLEDAGISGRLEADEATAGSTDVGLLAGVVRLVVPSDEADRAHAILDRLSWRRDPRPAASESATEGSRDGRAIVLLVAAAVTVLIWVLHAI